MAYVLIVNDDTAAGAAMGTLLRRNGHPVCCCARPAQALRRCRESRFQVAWLAWPLAGVDWPKFVEHLFRRSPALRVIVTGSEQIPPEMRLRLKALGVKMVLPHSLKDHVVIAVTEMCAAEG